METVYLSPKEAASRLQVSLSTVYRRARNGCLAYRREDGRIRIAVEHTQAITNECAAVGSQESRTHATAPPNGAQRELVIRPRDRIGGFYQVFISF
jgi:excisionase family DNA binding protein